MCVLEILGAIVIVTAIFTIILLLNRPVPDGKMVITTDLSGKKVFSLELDKTPEELALMSIISFKVVTHEDLVN